jgi:hypothetical protein
MIGVFLEFIDLVSRKFFAHVGKRMKPKEVRQVRFVVIKLGMVFIRVGSPLAKVA